MAEGDTQTQTKPGVAKDSKLPPRKEGQVPRNHDEYMEIQNKQIEAQLEVEIEQQQSSQDEMQAIADDVANRANHNVVTVCDGNTSEPERFETLKAIEIYGEKGMSRYEVAPGDTYLKIVMVDATHPEEAPVSRKAEGETKR
jgi:hypothetical protein